MCQSEKKENQPEVEVEIPLLESSRIEQQVQIASYSIKHCITSKPIKTYQHSKTIAHEVESPNSSKPGYYRKEQEINRRAREIHNSGKVYSLEKSKEIATDQITEERRLSNQRRREREKISGIKRNRYRRPGYDTKEETTGRKIAKILGSKSGVFKHVHARKMAEEWYADSHRTNSREYRNRKKAQNNNSESHSMQNTKSDSPK